MPNNKPLSEMTPDELAQLSPDRFKELSDAHNDQLELKENARNRELEQVAAMPADEIEREMENLRLTRITQQLQTTPAQDKRMGTLRAELDKRDIAAVKDFLRNVQQPDLDGPDNPLNYPEARKFLETDQRLTPEQQASIANHDKEPLSPDQQRAILKALEQPAGGYGQARLGDPEREVNQLLEGLVEPEHSGKSLLAAVVEAVKELPSTIREKMAPNAFQRLLEHQDDYERERTLDDDEDRW